MHPMSEMGASGMLGSVPHQDPNMGWGESRSIVVTTLGDRGDNTCDASGKGC